MSTPHRTGTTLGHYQVGDLIGRGGMGEVYRAVDTQKNREVALKLLNPEMASDTGFRARFMRESRTAAQLNDPHVIPIHDWGEVDGLLYIDMRLVSGADLRKILADGGPLPTDRALAIVGQVADALDSAHEQGLVHRDVKPDNILVDHRDFAYLVDFGLAQAVADSRLTNTGSAVGSFAYMAPERFGDSTAGPAADIYALGCVLYECLTGAAPFAVTTIERLVAAHLSQPPPVLDSPIGPVIAWAMDKDPARRPATAGEFVRAARDSLDTPGAAPSTIRPVPPPPVVRTAPPTSAPPTSAPPTSAPAASADRRWDPTLSAPVHSYGTAPSQPIPLPEAPRRSRGVPVLLTLIVVCLIAIAALGTWLVVDGRGGDDPATAADTTALSTAAGNPPAGAPNAPTAAPGATAPNTAAPNTAAPTPTAPAPQRPTVVPGDLGLSTPMTRPACDGTGIVVVGNATNPPTYAAEVSAFLRNFPGSSYLRTDQSCSSLRQSVDGNAIYAIYQVAGRTEGAICALKSRIGGYGKWLNTTTDPTTQVTC